MAGGANRKGGNPGLPAGANKSTPLWKKMIPHKVKNSLTVHEAGTNVNVPFKGWNVELPVKR